MDRATGMRDLLGDGAVIARLESPNKKQILQDLAQHASKCLGIEEHVLFDVLWERERLGTTGVGAGIAIPHGRVTGLDKVVGFFARTADPVAFESVDNQPVDLIFLLLAPEGAGADHLHALATVSRLMRDAAFCDKLRKAKDETALVKLLTSATPAEAA